MGGQLVAAGDFLIRTCFDLYITAVMLRFILQMVRADFYNPVCQFLITITNPVLVPLRRFIPGYAGIDLAAVVLLILLQVIKFLVLFLLLYQLTPAIAGLLLLAVGELLKSVIMLYFFAIIMQAIISWVNPGAYNPVLAILYAITEPVLRPLRNFLPPIGGLDLSPLLALILLQLLNMVLAETLVQMGTVLAVGITR